MPSYSFLKPNYGGSGQNDQHPPSDIRAGEKLIADIYSMVKASPEKESTILIITYDEYGDSYDRVPPPGGEKIPISINEKVRMDSSSIGLIYEFLELL